MKGPVSKGKPHISVCICTYKRPELLKRSLETVCTQVTDGLFTYSIVVVDNDQAESARAVVSQVSASSVVPLKYCLQPRQNIAQARNTAVENATGDFLTFLDDDEFAVTEWLRTLFLTIKEYKVDGVLGPVKPYFEDGAPQWIIKGGFYDRPVHATGMILEWSQCRTGNVLLKKELFWSDSRPFNPECLSGEDQDFFRRKIEEGHTFAWCSEAPVYEIVPATRWRRSFLARRALFRGIFAQRNHGLQPLRVMQAVISIPLYVLALPVALIFGQASCMNCVFKLSYHLGRLFALFGFNPIRQPYVTD
jgi:glycosyltransferase involved in cell wall biosynthesis